jgi:hypothetical protein
VAVRLYNMLGDIPELDVDEHAKLKTKLKTKLSSQPSYGTGFRYIGSPTTRDSAIGSPTTRDSAIGLRFKWGQVSLIPKGSHKGWSEGSHKDKGCDRRGSAIP